MVSNGMEVILGVVDDPTFGPVVTVGLGGVLTELLQDTSSRVAPIDIGTAKEMLSELRGAPVLFGYRKSTARDVDALAAAIVQLANIAIATPALTEMEINPLFVMPQGGGVYAADAMCSLRSAGGTVSAGPATQERSVVVS
jgi:succinyl-CoA synthetase beta subunit